MKYIPYIIIIYLVLINITGFVLMGIDKKKAQNHKWRIKECTLFISALLGGSIGAIAGMYTFRHKTRHTYFVIGMPAILIVQAAIGIVLYIYL